MQKRGPWERKYHSKVVIEVTEETVSQTQYFLGAITSTNKNDEQWTIQFGRTVKFKIDAGVFCKKSRRS